MKVFKFFIFTSLIAILGACGAQNDTPMDAAKTFMKSLVDGDVELNSQVNHSDALSFPPRHMIDMANNNDLVGKSMDDFIFSETDDPQAILVTWKEKDETEEWVLNFNQEKDGYFFVDLD